MHEAIVMDRSSSKAMTWLGLGISLFSMILIREAFRAISAEPGPALVLAREACMFAAAGALVWIVRRGERASWQSIGIGTSPAWKSLAWGFVIAIANVVPIALIAHWTGYGHSASAVAFAKLPLWVIFIVVVRAGVVEELFYRAYAIDRLQRLGCGRIAACAIPLCIFAVGHWTGGFANIVIALVAGGIVTVFYLWRRDLLANIFGHFLVDFVGNILPALFS
ncbi:MAG TPA: type II CAAX endopeptidase family protein [Terriglobales bacterium]|nr:type II CAAX endopeptidase family protein [Terriglobales bacterium]